MEDINKHLTDKISQRIQAKPGEPVTACETDNKLPEEEIKNDDMMKKKFKETVLKGEEEIVKKIDELS